MINMVHGDYFHDHMESVARRFYVTLEKIAAAYSAVILSQKRENIQLARRERIERPDPLELPGNGIDRCRFDRGRLQEQAVVQLRTELTLLDDTPIVSFVGRLVAEKGIVELLNVTAIIRAVIPDVKFLIISPYDEKTADSVTLTVAGQGDLENSCVVTGLRQDMPELSTLMNVVVLPSHREGFLRAAMEASAMCVPCVVGASRGCREVVKQGQNGRLVPRCEVAALSTAVINLLTDKALVECIAAAGKQIAPQEFDEQQVFDTIKAQYVRLTKEKGLSAA